MGAGDNLASIDRSGDTYAVRLERVIAHPPEAVWEALTSSAALERWLTTAGLEPRAGGEAWFDFGDGPARSVVTVWDPPRSLAYGWPFPDDGEGRIAWALEPSPGGSTRLVLEHTGLPPDWAAGYGSGWHAYVERLAAELAGDEPREWAARVAELRPLYDV